MTSLRHDRLPIPPRPLPGRGTMRRMVEGVFLERDCLSETGAGLKETPLPHPSGGPPPRDFAGRNFRSGVEVDRLCFGKHRQPKRRPVAMGRVALEAEQGGRLLLGKPDHLRGLGGGLGSLELGGID